MTRNFRRLLVLALFALALNVAASAQDFGHEVRASIPFNFYAGDKVMPAGNYIFAINPQNHNMEIFQKDSGIGMFLLGSPDDGSSNGRTLLIFRTSQEGVYVLQKLQGPDIGLSFNRGKALPDVAESRGNNTQVVLAQLVK